MAKFVAVFVFLFVVLSVAADTDAGCEEGECSKSDIHPSYDIDDCTSDGTAVTATCSTNQTITVPLTCNNGAWNDTLDEPCEGCSTNDFEDDEGNLMLTMTSDKTNSGRVPVNTLVSFSCNENHALRGPKSVLCVGQDEWNDTNIPYCIGMCPDQVVENGDTIDGAVINSTATVTCSEGFKLNENSSATITCQTDRSWSSTPQCESGTIRFVALYCVTFLAVTIAVLMSHQ